MKLSFKTIGLAILSLAFLASCSREIVPEGQETPDTPRGPETITVTINASHVADSRTMIDEDRASLWTAGDKLSIRESFYTKELIVNDESLSFGYENKTNYFIQWVESEPAVNTGAQEQFTAHFRAFDNLEYYSTLTSLDQIEEFSPRLRFRYQAFYPSEYSGNGSMSTIAMVLSPLQKPESNTFDKNADLLYSRPVYTATQPTELTLQFKRISALGIMTLGGLPSSGEIGEGAIVKNVQFISGITGHENEYDPGQLNAPGPRTRTDYGDICFEYCPPLAGMLRTWDDDADFSFDDDEAVNMNDISDLEFFDYVNIGYDSYGGYILDLDYTGKTVPAKDMKVYFSCLPAMFASGSCFTVKVTVDDNGKTKTYSRTVVLQGEQELTFTSGIATKFTVNMESAEVTEDSPIAFNEKYTLPLFPDLSVKHPVIRIPQGYARPLDIYFASELDWEVGVSADDADWLELYANGDEVDDYCYDLHVISEGDGSPRSGTILFNCLDDHDLSFEMTVQEFNIVTLFKDGVPVANDEEVTILEGTPVEFEAVVEIPAWMDLVNYMWYLADQNVFTFEEHMVDGRFKAIITGNEGDSYSWLYFACLIYDSLTGNEDEWYVRCLIDVDYFHFPLYYNGEDVYDGYIEIVAGAAPITLTADVTGFYDEEDIDYIEWYADRDYEWYDGERQGYVGGSILSFTNSTVQFPMYTTELSGSSSGFDYACFRVYFHDGTFVETYCAIGVNGPIDIFMGDEKVTEISFSASAGEITLTAVPNLFSKDDREYSYWFSESDYVLNENTGRYEYIDDGDDMLTLIPDPDDPYKITIQGEEGKGDTIHFHILLNNGKDFDAYCIVSFGDVKSPKGQWTSPFLNKNSYDRAPLVLKRGSRHHSR